MDHMRYKNVYIPVTIFLISLMYVFYVKYNIYLDIECNNKINDELKSKNIL